MHLPQTTTTNTVKTKKKKSSYRSNKEIGSNFIPYVPELGHGESGSQEAASDDEDEEETHLQIGR